MPQGWNSDFDRDAMLRRVAIVLSSLPAAVGNRLLGSMGEESRTAVRRTMTRLTDVDPLERQRALHAFRISMQQQPESESVAANATEATSRVMSSGSVEVATTPTTESKAARPDSPLAFLSDVDDDTLLALISVEHPQAIALVLASVSPAQAARLLPRMEERLRRETLSRLGRLGEIPEAAAAEVAEHFRERLGSRGNANPATGQRALDAILAAMPSDRQAAEFQSPVPQQTSANSTDPTAALEFPSADRPAMDLSEKLREAVGVDAAMSEAALSGEASMAGHSQRVDRVLSDEMAMTETGEADESVLTSTDSIHQYLVSMPPIELCQSLGKVSTRDAMLTLCGLPNNVTEAALAVLPRGQAKKVRSSMNGLGSLQLREIDEAKERVARASISTTDVAFQSMPMAA